MKIIRVFNVQKAVAWYRLMRSGKAQRSYESSRRFSLDATWIKRLYLHNL